MITYLDFLGVFTHIKKLLSLLQPGLEDALLLGLRVAKPTSNLVLIPSELIEQSCFISCDISCLPLLLEL